MLLFTVKKTSVFVTISQKPNNNFESWTQKWFKIIQKLLGIVEKIVEHNLKLLSAQPIGEQKSW